MQQAGGKRTGKRHAYTAAEQEKLASRIRKAACLTIDPTTRKQLSAVGHCGKDLVAFRNTNTRGIVLKPSPCRKKYCPRCGPEWSNDLKERLTPALRNVPPNELRHLVLTIPNAQPGELDTRREQLFSAFRNWRDTGRQVRLGGWWKEVQGYSYKLEIDAHHARGWHPHLHILIHCPGGFDATNGSKPREQWIRSTRNAGAEACGRNGMWITTCKSSNVAREVGKYCMKPLQVQHMPARNFIELSRATRGVRFQASGGTLRHASPDESPGNDAFQYIGGARALVSEYLSGNVELADVYSAVENYLEAHPGQMKNWEGAIHPHEQREPEQ